MGFPSGFEPPEPPEESGAVGPYRLLERIGEGGFGVVWLAEQTEPIRRRVALKLIKPGMDSRQVLARFEAERQALAVMDHPGIARVHDGGTTPLGRAFFAMELVKGEPVTAFCDKNKLPLTERVELFIALCEAVQHAHMKGVIHRDLKPSNILAGYDAEGRVVSKVIDFGVAKALNQNLSGATVYTQQGQLIGTPEYMSPEQAEMSGSDIDTRSDVYALGVILYELLSGGLPFESETFREAGFAEIQRIIREVEPPKPSTRLAQPREPEAAAEAARRRRTEIRALSGTLKRDLDWVVMKCLEKDRGRRYETASALAADLRRFLNDEPVLAGPPSAAYRVSKFVKRNRAGVAAGAAAALLLVAGFAGTMYGLVQAERAEAEAKDRAEKLQRVAEFQAEQLSSIDPERMGSRIREAVLGAAPESGRAALRSALGEVNFTSVAMQSLETGLFAGTIEAIDQQFREQPLVRAQLLMTLGETLQDLGLIEMAERPHRDALEIRRAELGDDHPDTLTSINKMGFLLKAQGRLDEAEPYHREALERRRRVLGDDHEDTMRSISVMGLLLNNQGNPEAAEPYYREALERRRRALGDDHPDTLTSINNMGFLLKTTGRVAEAEPYYREALEGCRRVLGNDHPDTLRSVNNMGALLKDQGRLSEAEPYLTEALAARRRTLGDDHPNTLITMSNLAQLLAELGRGERALALADETVDTGRRTLGDRHWYVGNFLGKRGLALRATGRLDEAEAAMLEAHDILSESLGVSHVQTARVAGYLADLYGALESRGAAREGEADRWRALASPGS